MAGDLRAVDKTKALPGEESADTAGTRVKDNLSVTPEEHSVKSCFSAALDYIALDIPLPVLPGQPGKKHPYLKKWQDKGSTDPVQVKAWWRAYPRANVCILTGGAFFVLDVDGPIGRASIANYPDLPKTVQAKSGREDGGEHFYFKMPVDFDITNAKIDLEKVDIRGTGGQCMAPPSIHPNGKPYIWINSPLDTPIADCPAWLEKLCRAPKQKQAGSAPKKTAKPATARLKAECDKVADTPEGRRNIQLNDSALQAGHLINDGKITRAEAEAALTDAARRCGLHLEPDGERKIAATIKSGLDEGELTGSAAPEDEKTTQAEALYQMAQAATFFRNREGVCYATTPDNETFELQEKGPFRSWLLRQFRAERQRIPGTSATQQAMAAIIADADAAPMRDVAIRAAATDGGQVLWLDLGEGKVVRVDKDGWNVTTELSDECTFVRPPGFQPIPEPKQPVTPMPIALPKLRSILGNCSDVDFKLIVAWMLAALRPGEPMPVLFLTGKQGSAKSTTAKIIRYIIDPLGPDGAGLTRPPRNDMDVFAILTSVHILAVDNISHITEHMSNTLSSVATGGGLAGRKFYTNNESSATYALRPIILNGIGSGASSIASKADMLDRAISITLGKIDTKQRQDDATIWRQVKAIAPAVLGELLTAASVAIRRLPTLEMTEKPRMASFAMWVAAGEPALWTGEHFVAAYKQNRIEADAGMLERSELASTIQKFARQYCDGYGEPWHGTATDLRDQMTVAGQKNDWTPRKIYNELQMMQDALHDAGVEVIYKRSNGTRTITFKQCGDSAATVPHSATE